MDDLLNFLQRNFPKVRIETVDRKAILTGRVATFYQKQMVQETAKRHFQGQFQVENNVEVD